MGDRAPDFMLPDAAGRMTRPFDALARGPLVLYFYPKDRTPGCTREACAFRDDHGAFTEAGATVYGVSGDSPESHAGVAQTHALPFPLLSDRGDRVRDLYGIQHLMGWLPRRITFVVDREGMVRHVTDSQWRPRKHVSDALRTVKRLSLERRG